jgi:hypothetical protein
VRWLSWLSFAGALTAAPQGLAAQEQPDTERGVWAIGALGPSYVAGEYEWVGQANPGYGVSGELGLKGDVGGLGGMLLGAFGYRIDWIGLGLGADLTVASAGSPLIGETSFDLLLAASLSVVGVVRTPGGVFGALWLGGSRHAFTGGTNDIGSAENIVEFEPLYGPSIALGGGYFWNGIGVFARVSHARLESDHASFNPWLLTAGVALAAW